MENNSSQKSIRKVKQNIEKPDSLQESENRNAVLKDEKSGRTGVITRIFAVLGLIVIVGLYILSLVASLSDWENSFGIFVGALSATIFVPIVIYLIKLFSNKEQS